MLKGNVLAWNSGMAFRERAMRQLSTLVVVGMFVVPLAGCNSDNQESEASTPASAPEIKTQTTAKAFTQPAVVTQPKVAIASPGLIQPTNSTQRVKQVEKGRQDPFAGLFAQVNYSVPTAGTPQTTGVVAIAPQRTVQGLSSLGGETGASQSVAAGSRRSSSNRSSASARSRSGTRATNTVARSGSGSSTARANTKKPPGSTTTSGTRPNPTTPPNPDTVATGTQSGQNQPLPVPPVGAEFPGALPPPQQPDLAQKVAVSGVVQIGEQVQAIVRVPNEGASRYVSVGQRLSNGEVLVKRIEMNQGAEPVVILEQYGVEVAKAIGEPAQSQADATNTPSDGSSTPESPTTSPSPSNPESNQTPPTTSPTTPPPPPGGLVPTTPPTTSPSLPRSEDSDTIQPDSSETP